MPVECMPGGGSHAPLADIPDGERCDGPPQRGGVLSAEQFLDLGKEGLREGCDGLGIGREEGPTASATGPVPAFEPGLAVIGSRGVVRRR